MNNSLLFKRFLKTKHYYEICREERNFAALLYHFLLDKKNLKLFLSLISDKNLSEGDLKHAEIYYEYACLRDIWHELLKDDNQRKGQYIAKFLNLDEKYKKSHFEEEEIIKEFNKQFGAKSEEHIESPSRWTFKGLVKLENDKELFLSACMLKWAFNIKPDIVIIIPKKINVCIEAKLESKEDKYPSKDKDKFTEILTGYKGKYAKYLTNFKKTYVTQTKMQKFLFKEVLKFENTKYYIIKTKRKNKKSGETTKTDEKEINTIYWVEIFKKMKKTNSFVAKFLSKNKHLQ